jgi:hypothetical protein
MTNVHVIAIQGELLRLRAEIKQLLSVYLKLKRINAPLDERKQLRSQIKMLMCRGHKLQFNLSDKKAIDAWLYEIIA